MLDKLSKTNTLESKLKKSDPHIKSYVSNLKKCIKKLELENSQLTVNNAELNERIKAMTAEIKKAVKRNTTIKIIRDNI